MGFDDEIDERRRRVALFRQAVIGELEAPKLERGELSARIAELAEKSFEPPWGGERSFCERTLWTWWSDYKREGLAGLVPCLSSSTRAEGRCVQHRLHRAPRPRQQGPRHPTAAHLRR